MYWCFRCYGLNPRPSGRCQHCGEEIAAPPDISFDERLIWTLGHPDGDRALLAAQTLGRRHVIEAVPRLRELATSSTDPFLAAEALRSLLRLENADTLRPLLRELARNGAFMIAEIAGQALQD